MDKDLDLNTSGSLPDGTKASQSGGFGATPAELRAGFKRIDTGDKDEYIEDPNAQQVLGGNDLRSGFLGRPEGWQR